MNVLVINCGSSSLKFQLINAESEEVLAKGICERIGIDGRLTYQPEGGEKEKSEKAMPTHTEAIQFVIEALTNPETGVVNSLDEITEPIMKLAVYESAGLTDEYVRYWTGQFGQRCTVVTSGNDWVDFIPFTTNKARGLAEYQKILNIKPEECITFGDEYNDIDMLKSVPYGFAMAHAKPGVKEVAAYETDRVQTILKKLIKAKGNIEEVLKECIQKKQ